MRKRLGFTFVEIVIVAAIISILAAIAVPNFLEAQIRAVVARSKADLATLKIGVEAYRMENRAYPMNSVPGKIGVYDLTVLTTPVPYLPRLMDDPFTIPSSWSSKRDPRSLKREPFRYFNALQAAPDNGLTFQDPLMSEMSGYIAGLLIGYGPKSPDPQSTTNTSISSGGAARLNVYDATNGTRSEGDLYMRLP